jgi:hypothetical protein
MHAMALRSNTPIDVNDGTAGFFLLGDDDLTDL